MHAAPALRSVAAVAALLVSPCAADLRMASQPKNGYKVNERSHYVPFVSSNASKVTIFRETYSVYMEPSGARGHGRPPRQQAAVMHNC